MNNVMLLGRLKSFKDNYMNLLVKDRSDEILIILKVSEGILEKAKEYINVGDLISVKGRIMEGNIVVAENISFLQSN